MATTDAGRGELGEHEIMIQRALIGSALLAVVAIAAHSASAEAGRLFKRSVGLTPAQYRRRFGSMRRALEHHATLPPAASTKG